MKSLAIFVLGSLALILVAKAVPKKIDDKITVDETQVGDYPVLENRKTMATKLNHTLPLMVQESGEEMVEENCRQIALLKQETEQLNHLTLKLKTLIQRTK